MLIQILDYLFTNIYYAYTYIIFYIYIIELLTLFKLGIGTYTS